MLLMLLQACMMYSYKNPQAAVMYDAFRERAKSSDSERDAADFVDSAMPCLLHPVKATRSQTGSEPKPNTQDSSDKFGGPITY